MLPVFGLRAGEALSRQVRDIDRGRIWHLHIDEDVAGRDQTKRLKTESSRRRLEIPPRLSLTSSGWSQTGVPRSTCSELREPASGFTINGSASPEQLLDKLPTAMLARLAELISQRTALFPTECPNGGKLRT